MSRDPTPRFYVETTVVAQIELRQVLLHISPIYPTVQRFAGTMAVLAFLSKMLGQSPSNQKINTSQDENQIPMKDLDTGLRAARHYEVPKTAQKVMAICSCSVLGNQLKSPPILTFPTATIKTYFQLLAALAAFTAIVSGHS